MKKSVEIAELALRTSAAHKEESVISVYDGTILKVAQAFDMGCDGYYIGVKNTDVISFDFKKQLESANFFVHTIDAMALGGRAVDIKLTNPITGRHMTGSSSGTAINVLKNINDLGVGTDGGGSVLAPALSLNLYAMISPLIDQQALRKYSKVSTDGIEFSPSIGFIAKRHEMIYTALKAVLDLSKTKEYKTTFAQSSLEVHKELNDIMAIEKYVSERVHLSYDGLNRQAMIDELRSFDFENSILVTCDGPVDLLEYGDSLMGQYDSLTKSKQELGHKYYLKVVNMLGLSAFIVPTSMHARGFLIICKSEGSAIAQAYELVKKIKYNRNSLEESYFDCAKRVGGDVL